MAESDESGKTRAMPPPELNPLLNPTLNKNLTRWAEVYFKSPPENRDQAVRELLRELEAGDSQVLASAAVHPSHSEESPANGAEPSNGAVQNSICPSCGFDTRPNQKFCGRCGARLGSSSTPNESRTERAPSGEDRAPRFIQPHVPERPQTSTASAASEPDDGEEPWYLQQEEAAPFWYSYRLYIGAGFAIVVLFLAYVAWQGAKAAPPSSKLPEQVPSAQSPASATPEPAKTTQPATAAPAPPPATSPNLPKTQEPGPAQTQTSSTAADGVPASTPQQGDSPAASSGYGADELATARHFLDAAHPDHAVAAEWLWKSVAKQNTEATLLLGQLYLRGQGVQKNCEQGRVLLDAAAKKGNKDAASLLQNLQAFGCQ